jgi:SAM-dependent methyltransferase
VLDVGPASGFFSFHLERTGADVVAFEIAREVPLDLVPYARGQKVDGVRESLDRVMNSFWYAHRLFGSRVPVAQGNVYAIPESIGEFDVALVGSVLLHLRDPFLALSQVAKQVRETLIVAEPVGIVSASWFHRLLRRSGEPKMMFLPNFRSQGPVATWWTFTPELLARFMAVLGFEQTRTVRHTQRRADGTRHRFFTVVGQRTRA